MKKIIYIVFLFLSAAPAFSQNTGFGGKRVLIKTDLLNGTRSPLISGSAEFLLTRRFTLTATYKVSNEKYRQIYYYSEYAGNNNYYYGFDKHEMQDKATLKSRTLSLEARWYKSGIVPAPKGAFFYGAYHSGRVDVLGNYEEALYTDLSNSGSWVKNTYYKYQATDVKIVGMELGWGYQSFINKYVTWGFKLGFNKTYFNADENWDPKVLSGVAKSYGPNLLRIYPGGGFLSESELLPTDAKADPVYKGSFGLSCYFQIGILLF